MIKNFPKLNPGSREFIVLMAVTMSMVAIFIDALLPALPLISRDFAIADANHQQFVISCFFGGLAIGQIFGGPISDSIGRKATIYYGVALFIIGSLICLFSSDFEMLLIGRFIQGIGSAAPRIMSVAIVRDCFHGRDMARVTSYILGVFILVPSIAPSIGQAIINVSNWHMIVGLFLTQALVLLVWMTLRLPETLHPEYRRKFDFKTISDGANIVLSNRQCVIYTITSGFVFGAFLGFLNSSPQIFDEYFNQGQNFAYYFGAMALSMGSAYFVNGSLVNNFGIHKIIKCGLGGLVVLATIFIAVWVLPNKPIHILVFMPFLMTSAFCFGLLFGNMNALAMEPMGHVAGIAASIIGCFSLIISATIGGSIGQMYNGTLLPLSLGFWILAVSSLILITFENVGKDTPSAQEL